MAKLVFRSINHLSEKELEDIFKTNVTGKIHPETLEIRNHMRQMLPGDSVEIFLQEEGDETISQEDAAKELVKMRAVISSTASILKWPFLPGAKRRAYQTAIGKAEDGRVYLYLRRLTDPAVSQKEKISV
jgi:hypothetical protein